MKKAIHRIISWFLCLALAWSLAAVGFPVTYATGTDETIPVEFEIQNATVMTAAGEQITESYEGIAGEILLFSVIPAEGCKIESVLSNKVELESDEDDFYSVEIQTDTSVSVICQDVTLPSIIAIVRQEAGWSQTASYTITAEDNIAVADVTLIDSEGNTSKLEENEDGTYTATILSNGEYTVVVADSTELEDQDTISETQIDTTYPEVIAIERETEGWSKEAIHQLSVTDADSGIQRVTVTPQGGTEQDVELNEDGTYSILVTTGETYTVKIYDAAGNYVVQTITDNDIDIAAPVIGTLQRSEEGWQKDTVTYAFAVEDLQSGVNTVTYTLDDGEPQELTPNEEGVYSVSVNQNCKITITAEDKTGNNNNITVTETQIDTVNPEIQNVTRQTSGWATSALYSFQATDSQSGVAYVSVSTGTDETMLTEQNGRYEFTLNENASFHILVKDAAGNEKSFDGTEDQVDTTPPDVRVSYSTDPESGYNRTVETGYIYNEHMCFYAQATDTQSGIAYYEYRIMGTNGDTGWISVTEKDEEIAQVVTNLADGVYSVSVRVHDEAGNCTQEYTVVENGTAIPFILENTPVSDSQRSQAPEVTAITTSGIYTGNWTNEDVTITVSGSSAVSGIEYYEMCIDYTEPALEDCEWEVIPVTNGLSQITVTDDTNAIYYFRAVTYAGNTSQITSATIQVQKTIPNPATLTQDAATGTNGWYTQYPGYAVHLPEQGQYAAPVRYMITYSHNGEVMPEIFYDGTNAPAVNEDGLWDITITAIDAAGNTAAIAESSAHFSVDTQAPTSLAVTMDGESILNIPEKGSASWDGVNTNIFVLASDFSIFKNAPAVIQAFAEGGDSGIAAIYYQFLTENTTLPLESGWIRMGADGLTLTPNNQYHLYFKAVDGAGNATYFSAQSILLDNTTPEITGENGAALTPSDTNRSIHGFYSGDVTVDINISDPTSGEDQVFSGLQSVTYRVLRDGTETQSGQLYPGSGTAVKAEGRVIAWNGSLTINAKANNSNHIVVEVTAVDMAGNIRTSRIEDGVIRIDIDAPVITSSYDNNDITATFNGEEIFTGSRTLTVDVLERNFLAEESFVYVTDTDTGNQVAYNWKENGNTYTAVIPVTQDGHYTVSMVITDLAGNTTTVMGFTEETQATTAFVIDNTNPEIVVSYDNNNAANGYYFSIGRTATVTVTERNFNPDAIQIATEIFLENGLKAMPEFSAWESNGNTHTMTISFAKEGVCEISVSGTDAVGNNAEPTVYQGKAPQNFVVDTHIDAPTFADVQNGKAYAGTIIPSFTALDTNLDTVTIQVFRTRRNEVAVDVTDEFLTAISLEDVPGGKTAALDIFPKEQDVDGIYTLVVQSTDKAGNTTESSVTFSVNRFGSVYVYDTWLIDTMGAYLQTLETDLILSEFNPSGLVAGSARVYITLDGVPITNPIYTVAPAIDGTEKPGESGWYEYTYTISKDNFTEEGVYEIVISTQDVAGNVPENTAEDMEIRFAIDRTVPELPSVIGMEKAIYKADSIQVSLNALDNVALATIAIYVDGELVASWENIDSYSSDQTFSIPSGLNHHVRIVVTDKAGNVLDTDSAEFSPGYKFQDSITVSTNVFLRFYANKPLFWTSTAVVALVVIGGIFWLWKRKKKNTNVPDENQDLESMDDNSVT